MASKNSIIADLRALVKKQAKQIDKLVGEVADRKLQLTKPKNSKGSGKPRRRQKPKIGGQPGHQRKLREPLPPERVNKTVVHELDAEEIGQLGLVPTDQYDATEHRPRLIYMPMR